MKILRRVLSLFGSRSAGRREAPGRRGGGRSGKAAAATTGLGIAKRLMNKRRR